MKDLNLKKSNDFATKHIFLTERKKSNRLIPIFNSHLFFESRVVIGVIALFTPPEK